MPYTLRSARYLASDYLTRIIEPGDYVIDATMGNGHDTAFLAQLVGPKGHVTAFDIQHDAVERTRELLAAEQLLAQCELHHMGHEHIPEIVHQQIRAAVFNLGWLPGGDKSITTLWETTRNAVQACLNLLVPGGIVSICAYPGHAAGDVERSCLTDFLSALRPQEFNVLHHRFLNAGSGAPENFIIQRNNQLD